MYQFSFIGLGLIGGSIAKALKNSFPDCSIRAYDPDTASVSLAKAENTVDFTYDGLADGLFDCDYLFLCAPVSENDALLGAVKEKLKPETILTDVGSVKQTTHKAIAENGLSEHFIGGHPMTGGEKTGFVNANPLILENSYYILTPTKEVNPEKVAQFEGIIKKIGALPLILDYETHDYITAAVSHLPHIIAASLVNLVRESDNPDGLMKLIAAGGFKDITRIASSSPVMWQSICMTNTENIKLLLARYMDSLEVIRQDLEALDDQKLYALFDTAKDYRDSFVNTSAGPIKRVYTVYVDIPDQPGSLAKTATILADEGISIQNIGIMHQREFQNGALRIEFEDEGSRAKAVSVLRAHEYTIYDE